MCYVSGNKMDNMKDFCCGHRKIGIRIYVGGTMSRAFLPLILIWKLAGLWIEY